ncbi:hypothetical protein V9T40_012965 [Parthenolecanium corni]|uniref:Uncharacterized protein n=1 Tax=Parthenolecanium corni TaxID=536013 RepID=A0AAN9XZX9_9HEMI
MAWGYWSAATVSDRARSPRRHTSTSSFANVSHFPSSLPPASIIPPPPPAAVPPSFHRSHPIYGHLQSPPSMAVCGSGSAVHHHHQAACYNHHNSSAVGSGSDDEYPPVASSLSRRPSFADIEFTGPVPAGRPLTLLLEGASLSRPPSALNTFPRSYHHHHHQGGPDARSSGRSMTAAASTNTLYARGSMRRGECYVHPQPPTIHYPQCLVHRKDYPSDDDDEPDPAYATAVHNGLSRIIKSQSLDHLR